MHNRRRSREDRRPGTPVPSRHARTLKRLPPERKPDTHRRPFNPRPLLAHLETESDTATVWHQLWEELHHQGDVGDASCAAVPHIVRICRKRRVIDWNTYAIVAIIELARTERKNPDVPEWLASDYVQAIRELAETGLVEMLHTEEQETTGAMLGRLVSAASMLMPLITWCRPSDGASRIARGAVRELIVAGSPQMSRPHLR